MNTLIQTLGKTFLNRRVGSLANKPPFKFHGGLALDPAKRALVGDIVELPVPPTLVLPLINYAKQPLTPLVQLGESVKRGQLVANGLVAPTSGVVRSIDAHETIHPDSLLVNSIVLDCDGLDECYGAAQQEGSDNKLATLTTAFKSEDSKEALLALDQFALSGLGGAGFPTAQKLIATKNQLNTLIINAAECEPEIACDEALMQSASTSIAMGIDAMVKLTQCKTCVLAIEDSKPLAIKSMELALKSIVSSIQVMVIPTRYPTGAESPLIQCVTGKFIPHGERPTTHGILCINVATAYAFWQALNGCPLDSRVVSLGGHAMPNPCNVRVRFGTSIDFILDNTNNASVIGTSRIRAGGPLSGFDLTSTSVTVTAKTNCILAEPIAQSTPAQPCIRCGQCADVCPAKLLPQQLHWYTVASDLKKLGQLKLDACIECGCCDLVCPASIKLTETFRYAKSQVAFEQVQQQKANDAELRFDLREKRVQQRALAKAAAIEQRKQSIKSNTQPDAAQISAALARAASKRRPKKT